MKSLSQQQQNCQINTSDTDFQNSQINTRFKCKFSNPASIVFQATDILLIPYKFQVYSSKCKITTEIVRPNGSKFLIPAQYHNYFLGKIQLSKIIFFPIKAHYCFVIGLNINFVLKESEILFDQSQLQQILQDIQICKNFLSLVGLMKNNIKSSLQIRRSQIKLKKELLKFIHNSSFEFNVLQINNRVCQNQTNVLPVKFIQQIKQSNIKENRIVKKGGYFTIQDKQCEVIKLNGQTFVKHLVKKRLRASKNQEKNKKKLASQLNFVREIKSNRYIVQYYFQQESKDHFYMDCFKDNLKKIIYSKDNKLTIDDIFSIAKQLIEALNILHKSGIVHRDLKLQNILIQTQNDCLKLKLIDFADSAFINASFDKNLRLGCTTPYSPVECLIAIEEGFNKSEIDLWSVIMVIYEIIFRQPPLFFSHALQQQLVEGWKGDEDFSTILSHRHKKGIRKLEEYVCLLTQQSLKIQQKQRLKLEVIMPFIQTLQFFYQQTCQKFLKKTINFHE